MSTVLSSWGDPENSQSLDGPRAVGEIQIPKKPLSGSVDPAGGSRGHITFRSNINIQGIRHPGSGEHPSGVLVSYVTG